MEFTARNQEVIEMSAQDPVSGPITFVNRFTVNGSPEVFEKAFTATAEFMQRQPGLLRCTLSRDVDREDSYVNVALWDDVRSLRTLVQHPEFDAHVASLRALATSDYGVYTDRLSFAGSEN